MSKNNGVKCCDSRKPECGGKNKITGRCSCLDSAYSGNTCPFYKPDFRVTNGIVYDYKARSTYFG